MSLALLALLSLVAILILAAFLTLFRLGDAETSIKALPWGVLLLISGISILIALLEKLGSLELATSLLASLASPKTLNALLAFVSGLASVGSSSSGVVMPLFIPLAPDILSKVGSGNRHVHNSQTKKGGIGNWFQSPIPLSTPQPLTTVSVCEAAR